MRSWRPRLAGAFAVAAAALSLSSCSGVGGTGEHVAFVNDCGVTQADLQGTWTITTKAATYACPSGALKTGTAPTTVSGVIAAKTSTGFDVTGPGLAGTVDSDTCHIEYKFVDRNTGAEISCFCTFVPATSTIGAGLEDAHCYSAAIDANRDGTRETGCDLSPNLDSVVKVAH